MLPITNILSQNITETVYPNRTYKIVFNKDIRGRESFGLNSNHSLDINSNNELSGFTIDENGVISISYNTKIAGYELSQDSKGVLSLTMSADIADMDRISGYIDDLEALTQTIYLILSTERYQYIIYSWDYGIELVDLFGKPMPYVMLEIQSRIRDALLYDNRIQDVIDFEFESKGKVLTTKFTVVSNIGNLTTALEVKF